jgi:hypothetical protein
MEGALVLDTPGTLVLLLEIDIIPGEKPLVPYYVLSLENFIALLLHVEAFPPYLLQVDSRTVARQLDSEQGKGPLSPVRTRVEALTKCKLVVRKV